jgi:hypothetical protein
MREKLLLNVKTKKMLIQKSSLENTYKTLINNYPSEIKSIEYNLQNYPSSKTKNKINNKLYLIFLFLMFPIFYEFLTEAYYYFFIDQKVDWGYTLFNASKGFCFYFLLLHSTDGEKSGIKLIKMVILLYLCSYSIDAIYSFKQMANHHPLILLKYSFIHYGIPTICLIYATFLVYKCEKIWNHQVLQVKSFFKQDRKVKNATPLQKVQKVQTLNAA